MGDQVSRIGSQLAPRPTSITCTYDCIIHTMYMYSYRTITI